MPRPKNENKDVSHLRFKKPVEGDRNYDVMKELWDFLNELGDLPFNPPFVSRPPAGSEAQLARAVYLMAMGMDHLKKIYPKHSASQPLRVAGAGVGSAPDEGSAIF